MIAALFNSRMKLDLTLSAAKRIAKRINLGPNLLRTEYRLSALQRRGANIHDLVIIESKVEIEGPARNLSIGEGSFIGAGTHINTHSRVNIGRHCAINRDVKIISASHSTNDPMWPTITSPIDIEDYAWIATGATILLGTKIGQGAIVGAAAVVTKDVPPYAIVAGNPARIVSRREPTTFMYSPVRRTALANAWLD